MVCINTGVTAIWHFCRRITPSYFLFGQLDANNEKLANRNKTLAKNCSSKNLMFLF